MSSNTNPFLNAEINAPNEFQEYFQRYSQTTGASTVVGFHAELSRFFHREVSHL